MHNPLAIVQIPVKSEKFLQGGSWSLPPVSSEDWWNVFLYVFQKPSNLTTGDMCILYLICQNIAIPVSIRLVVTKVPDGFAAKGLLIHMPSNSVATGLAHSKLIIRTGQTLTRRAMTWHIYMFIFAWIVYMTWVGLWLPIRQLSSLWRPHKVKAKLRCTEEDQNKAERCGSTYLAPCKNITPKLYLGDIGAALWNCLGE